MLSFAAEFPVKKSHEPIEFISTVKKWICGSPHTSFVESDLSAIPKTGEWRLDKGNASLRTLSVSTQNEEAVAVEYVTRDRHFEWSTTIVFSRSEGDAWIGTRIFCETNHPATRVPVARKPIFVRMLLDGLGGAADGALTVQAVPHYLQAGDVGLAVKLIGAKAGCRLPVIYVSSDFSGKHVVDVSALSNDLSGMAHVVVEPDRQFSRQLQIDTRSENVYGGTIGIYWPHGGARRSFFMGDELDSAVDIKRAIIDEIRSALINRRALVRCTWSSVQEAFSRESLKILRASGSSELNQYTEMFDKEMAAKDRKLAEAESEILRLEEANRELEEQFSTGAGVVRLRTGAEQDLYPGELVQVVRDAIESEGTRVQSDGRREHILKAILSGVPNNDTPVQRREELKEILRDYRKMDAKTRRALENMGFLIEEDGKHYKVTFSRDERYMFTIAKTGSDHRGGLKAAATISSRLF